MEFNRRLALETEGKTLDPAVLTAGVAAGLADPDAKGRITSSPRRTAASSASCMITCEWSDWRNGWIWWIQSVYVRPEARRRGVFRALYEHVHQAASADPQVIGLRLYVEHENHVAQQTYLSLGMELSSYVVLRALSAVSANLNNRRSPVPRAARP